VLDFSRLEQRKKKYSPKKIEMRSFIERFDESYLLHIQKAGLVLKKNIPADNIFVYMDKDVMGQALLNLIDNTMKYALHGGEITLSLKAGDKYAELRVMDRGKGINVSHRERIFTKFYRIDNSLTAPQPGSGLGLSIARRLLRDLNGDLIYEPREGGGSSFVILIPYYSDHKGKEPS
jgi:signal transduction histidine kinase